MIDTFLNCEDAWGMMDVISKATGKAVGFYRLIMSFRAGGSQVISCLLCSHIHLLIFPFFQINAYMYSPYSPLHFCNKPPPQCKQLLMWEVFLYIATCDCHVLCNIFHVYSGFCFNLLFITSEFFLRRRHPHAPSHLSL